MMRHRRHIIPRSTMEEPSKRKGHCHPVSWVLVFVSAAASIATSYLPQISSDLFEMQESKDLLLIEVPSASGLVFFLEGDPFPPVRGRSIQIFLADPSEIDSQNTSDSEHVDCEYNKHAHPTCNEFHTMDFQEMLPGNQASILSNKGSFRTAWEFHESLSNSTGISTTNTMVLKTLRPEHAYKEEYFNFQQVDAIVMEKLTASPYIIDMYSYCGMSVLTDFAETTVSRVLDKLTTKPVETLKLAKKVAKGISDMHREGVIHNDVNQANLAYSTRKQVPVFFDFNIAVFRKDGSCPFVAKFPNPQWRSPEELKLGNRLTEKVDIFALGNILFRFIDGQPPWGRHRKSVKEEQFILESKQRGKLPPFTSLTIGNDTATTAMIHVMEECYSFKPKDRPSANRVISMLNQAIHDVNSGKKLRHDDRGRKHRKLRGRNDTRKATSRT
jgi:hypothetical protein